MAMYWVGRIGSGDAQLDRDLRDLDIVTGPAGSFLYATTGQDGGISAYRLQADGGLARLIDSAHYTVWGMQVGGFDTVGIDGQQQVVLSGTGDGKLIRYRLEADGGLAKAGKIDLPGPTMQDHAALTATELTDGQTALYTVAAETGVLEGWRSTGAGGLDRALDTGLTGAAITVDATAPVLLSMAAAGGRSYLLAADSGTQGVRSFRVDTGTGALRTADRLGIDEGLGVALPTAMEVVSAHGTTWVVLAAAGSNSLSVMELTATGGLIPTDHILDTRATRFDGVTALEVVQVGDHVFVLAGGADDGLSLFTLLPDGHLVHRQTLVQDHGLGLENVTGITATRIGDALQIFVSSGREAGITQFSLPLAGLGTVIEASETPLPGGGAAALSGTAAADLLIGRDAQITLLGHAGDDILVAGSQGGVLTGGAGADLFVLRPTEQSLWITDFEAGIDQLDLSRFPMLRSTDQLTLIPTATGIRIGFGSTVIDITSATGTPLSFADLWPGGFITPDRIRPPEREDPSDGILEGGEGNDVLKGSVGEDEIDGGAGHDVIKGRAGPDRLVGGDGSDRVFGGAGNDEIDGGNGHDLIKGGAGHDRLDGGDGYDTIHGGAGNDSVWGGRGRDTVYLGDGNDVFTDDDHAGYHGSDTVFGGAGNDRIEGGGGDDVFDGGAGHDLLRGGVGNDSLTGGDGYDTIHGGAGNDSVWGGRGRDTVYLGDGNDVFTDDDHAGYHGSDTVFGGAGNDRIEGGGGDDVFDGGAGDDVMQGGAGADGFVFAAGHGADTITDFTSGEDVIRLAMPELSFADLVFHTVETLSAPGSDPESGAGLSIGTLIDTGSGTITLAGVAQQDLVADDFLFL